MNSSRAFLLAIYQKYANRACENLGVSADFEDEEDDGITLSDSDYPSEFKQFTSKERENYFENNPMSTEDFLSQFETVKKF